MTSKKTRIVKRYQNRKLYDTSASRYVTLDDIATLIREGEDVQVIDNQNQEDLTSVTLTQIIFEQEKKKAETQKNINSYFPSKTENVYQML